MARKRKPTVIRVPDTTVSSEASNLLGRRLSGEEQNFLNQLDREDRLTALPYPNSVTTPVFPSSKATRMFEPAPTKATGKSNGRSTSKVKCGGHFGTVLLYQNGPVQLFGGQGFKLDPNEFDVLIDCGNTQPTSASPLSGSKWFTEILNPFVFSTEVLKVEWPDFGVPRSSINLNFWQRLWAALKLYAEDHNKDPLRVCVCCVGGHGRTGTALCALLVADGMKPSDAIKHIRAQHCENSVEANKQVDYLFELYEEYVKATADLTAKLSGMEESKTVADDPVWGPVPVTDDPTEPGPVEDRLRLTFGPPLGPEE